MNQTMPDTAEQSDLIDHLANWVLSGLGMAFFPSPSDSLKALRTSINTFTGKVNNLSK